MPSLPAAKRAFTAMFVAVVLFAVTLTALVLAPPDDTVPDEMAFASRHVGEAGAYRFMWTDGDDADQDATLLFQWGAPMAVLGPGGSDVMAAPLQWQVGEEHGVWWVQPDGRVLREDHRDETTTTNWTQRDHAAVRYPHDQTLCLLMPPMQGETMRAADRAAMPFPCRLPGGIILERTAVTVQMAAVGPLPQGEAAEPSGPRSLLISDADGGVRSWHLPGLPYPLRQEVRIADGWFVAELQGHAPGDGAVIPNGPGIHTSAWPLRSLAQWGPDDAGADLPWLPSEAFQTALDDPTYPWLQDYLDEHPDAAPYWMKFTYSRRHHDSDLPKETQTWSFHLTDGDATHHVQVSRNFAPDGTALHLVETAPSLWRYAPLPSAPGRDAPLPPQTAPPWHDILHVLTTYARHDPQGHWAVSWTASSECTDDACHSTHRLYSEVQSDPFMAGTKKTVEESTPTGDSTEPTYAWGHATLDGEGRIASSSSIMQDGVRPTHPRIPAVIGWDADDPDTSSHLLAPDTTAVGPAWRSGIAVGFAISFLGFLYAAGAMLRRILVAGLLSRRARSVLDHPRRAAILHHIQEDPGIETAVVARELGLARGVARHHINRLHREGHLRLRRINGRTALFAADSGHRGEEAAAVLLRRKTTRRLYTVLVEQPGMDQAQLARLMGITQPNVSRLLRRMEAAGLVHKASDGGRFCYFATPEIHSSFTMYGRPQVEVPGNEAD